MKKNTTLGGREMVVNGITIAVAILLVYVIADYRLSEREDQRNTAQRQISSIVNLAADDVSRALGGVRESLRLLSRMPAMRATQTSGVFSAKTLKLSYFCRTFLEILESDILNFSELEEKRRMKTLYYYEVFLAGLRRVSLVLGFPFEFQESPPPQSEIPDAVSKPRLSNYCQPVLKTVHWFNDITWQIALPIAAFLDLISGKNLSIPADLNDIQRLLITSLSDTDLIRSLEIRTLDGKKLSRVTEVKEPIGFLNEWVRLAGKSSRSFFPGPVWFDEGLGRPMWNAAMLIRDSDYKPYAVLTSQIDLAFLTDLIHKAKISSASYMFLVDEDGTIISHPKASVVANQVNAGRSNPMVAEVLAGNDGFGEIQIGGTTFFTAYRHLRNLDRTHLPGWGILYMLPTSEAVSGTMDVLFRTIIWLALAFYVLFYVNDQILTSLEEEWEA